MGAPALDVIRKELPGQFVNVGIAEQNAITLAAGLALSGKKVFAYAIAPFITLRCLEQIRVENAMMKIPVTIVGVGSGFGYEDSGPTHHLIEDIAIMRTMPNIRIDSISDNTMAEYFARECCKPKKITDFVRLDRLYHPDIYDQKTDFSKGFAVLRKAKTYYIISTGTMTHLALAVADELRIKKTDIGVIDLFNLPIREKELLPLLMGVKKIISMEEHFLAGGLGSAIAESLSDKGILIPHKRIGIPQDKGYCYQYGGREVIRNYYGIDKVSVTTTIKSFIAAR
jgi:transketolase